MAFIGMIIAPLILAFIPGLVCLILSSFMKARRKRLLVVGSILCAPLLVFILVTIIGSLVL